MKAEAKDRKAKEADRRIESTYRKAEEAYRRARAPERLWKLYIMPHFIEPLCLFKKRNFKK